MPAYYSPTANVWITNSTSCNTLTAGWNTNYYTNQTAATTSCTNTVWWVQTQPGTGDWYGGNQPINQQPQVYPSISRQEQERQAAREDQKAYEKALREHNAQQARLIKQRMDERTAEAARQRRAEQERQRLEAERRARWAAEEEERRKARTAADARARELLLEHLTDEQRDTFEKNNWFVIEGGQTKTKYRIRADASLVANVDVMDDSGGRLHRLCAHARSGTVPLGDQLLAQKIMLESDEDAFLRVANRHAA